MKSVITLFTLFLIASLLPAQNGLLAIQENGKWGLINEKGAIIVKPIWDMANGRSDHGVVSLRDPKATFHKDVTYGIVDTEGNFLLGPGSYKVRALGYSNPAIEGLQIIRFQDKEWIADALGNSLMETPVDQINHFSNKAETTFKLNGKHGMLSHKGEILVPANYASEKDAWRAWVVKDKGTNFEKYDIVMPMSEGLSAVYNGKVGPYGDTQEDNWGFANKKGELVIPAQFSRVFAFSKGLAYVEKGKNRGIINLQGEYILPLKYKFLVGPFNDRFLVVENNNSRRATSYLYDLKGNLLHTYKGELSHLNNRYMGAQQTELLALSTDGDGQFYGSDGIGVIRTEDGKELLPPVYNYVRDAGEGTIKFAVDCQCDTTRATFGLCTIEEQGYTAVASGCKFGLADGTGKILFEPEFDNIGIVAKGKAYAVKDGDLYVITLQGEKRRTDVILPKYMHETLGFFQTFAGIAPHQPVVIGGHLVLEGNNLNPASFEKPESRSVNVSVSHIRGDIYKIRLDEGQFGYVHLPAQQLIYWCGERPAGLEEWIR